MSLGGSLALVMIAFLAILAGLMAITFRERKAGRAIGADDFAAQGRSDARVLMVIFAAIPGGMVLTILVAWLVFL